MPIGFSFRRAARVGAAALAALAAGAPQGGAADEKEPGIPIRSEAVKTACGTCHAADAAGALSRISWRRTTPEGWQETIKRMATLNHAPLEPGQAREALRYLANELGLAPEEVEPVRFEVEKRQVEYHYANTDVDRTCGACHSVGRALLQRRTGEEWDLLVAMHRGYYPLVDFQAFRHTAPPPSAPGPDGRPPDRRHPVEKALDHLKATFPLRTAAWSAWTANRRTPRLAGRWALSGHEPGRGPVFGEVRIAEKAGRDDEFETEIRYASAGADAAPVVRRGQAVVYTGFQWRGRSTTGSDASAETALREVMQLERDGRTLTGRWFGGGYDERGLDVTLTRIGVEAMVTGLHPRALRAGAAASVRVFGVNLTAAKSAADVDLGPGVRVKEVAPREDGLLVQVEVAEDAAVGERDAVVAGVTRPRAAVVYRTVDALKVSPEPGLARIGGIRFPKRFEQFEARAWSHGADGKPGTEDDLDLGVARPAWSLEEFTATFGDDDTKWVGALGSDGLFTPAEDGPNPKRSGSRNNVGDVWVVATLPADPAARGKAPLRARAHLVVTVPLYMRWDQPEVMP